MVYVDRRRGAGGRRRVQRLTGGDHLDTPGLRAGHFRLFLGFVGLVVRASERFCDGVVQMENLSSVYGP